MYGIVDHKEGWASKNWCFWTVVLEKTLESPLTYKKIQPVHPTRSQSWRFFGRTNVEAEAPIVWPPNEKWLIRKDCDAGKDPMQEAKRATEDEMVGQHHQQQHHRVNEFEQAPGNDGLCLLSIKLQETLLAAAHWVAKSGTRLSNWTTTMCMVKSSDWTANHI